MKTNNTFFAAVIFLAGAAASQGQTKQWDRRFGGSADDDLYSVQQTKDGGYVMCGETISGLEGDKSQALRGNWDMWVVKVDATGAKQWDQSFGGNSADVAKFVQQTKEGGYIVGGYSQSGATGDKTQASRGGSDYWIIKLNSAGTKVWDRCFGGSALDCMKSMQQTSDGGYILGGYSASGVSGDKTEESRGGHDYWLVKVDANGNKQWDKRFGGETTDILTSMALTSDGGYILGGYSVSGVGGDKTELSRGDNDFWVVKVSATGAKQWDKRFGGSSDDRLESLQPTTDGGYILGGYSHSGASGDKSEATRGFRDYWIVKINASGAKQWDKRFGGVDTDTLHSIRQATDGGYLLAGESNSGVEGDVTQETRGSTDFWIVKVDAWGKKRWDKRFGGSSVDQSYSAWQTADGGYILGGYSASGMDHDKSQATRGGYDFWIVKIGVLRPDAYENDSAAGLAKAIANGTTQTHSIHEAADEDWAKFTVGGAGAVNALLETSGTAGDTELWLHTSTGSLLRHNDDIGSPNKFSRIATNRLNAGTYYVKVAAFGNNIAIPAYALKARWTQLYAPDRYEADNKRSAAKRIRSGRSQNRNIHAAGNVDWAKFTIGSAGARSIRIQTSGASGDTELRLYNRAGRRLATDDNSGPGKFSRIQRARLAAGTYYVQVREKGSDGTIAAYKLSAKWAAR
jgi:hypothetical protein